MNKATYVSNAGVLLELGNKKILIDALCNSNVPIYKTIPDAIRDRIIEGRPPYDGIDLMLFTHEHGDHFKAQTTAEFMRRQPQALLVSTGETIRRLKEKAPDLDACRMIQPKLKAGEVERLEFDGLELQVMSMIHDGKGYRDVENFAFLIEANGARVLHVGDAKPTGENYGHLNLVQSQIDLALVPFPYVGIPSGQLAIQNYIQPRRLAALHLPYADKDQFNWIAGTKKSFERVRGQLPETVFLEGIGDELEF